MIRCKCGGWLSLVRPAPRVSDLVCLRCGYSVNRTLTERRNARKAAMLAEASAKAYPGSTEGGKS